jgi:hypothetical protein
VAVRGVAAGSALPAGRAATGRRPHARRRRGARHRALPGRGAAGGELTAATQRLVEVITASAVRACLGFLRAVKLAAERSTGGCRAVPSPRLSRCGVNIPIDCKPQYWRNDENPRTRRHRAGNRPPRTRQRTRATAHRRRRAVHGLVDARVLRSTRRRCAASDSLRPPRYRPIEQLPGRKARLHRR